MSKGLFRLGFLGLPVLAASFAIVAACSSDDDTGGTTTQPDAAQNPLDSSIPRTDSSTPLEDGGPGLDAADAADQFVPPPLCKTYPDNPADASVAEGPRKLYELIAVRALLEAADSCEVGSAFQALEDPPSQLTCFGKQLASLAGCLVGGAPIDYNLAEDENGAKCIAVAAGDDTVKAGFRNPATGAYSNKDVDFLIALTKKAAISTGMPAADAERLRALLAAQRATAAADGGGPGDGGTYTQSTCP
ncbi:MAG TPA: hypothetical protein VLT33_42545 [Labilithrix sp.]|nr:hypothetical protein [Labilithrix sp.]